ncbi:MAG: hypothetical protein KF899_06145 [Parvibaculum sp.]|nr:hypothetical protein [Parvibaculum sp.]
MCALMSAIARVSLPDRGNRGWLAMLECYFDDSGTHDGSAVVVWGGVAGHKFYLDQLDAAWRARLLCPCDGKPPIKKFRSYDLEHGIEEFDGYNQGERDLTRRNFRQVIVESSASVIAWGLSVRDWDQIVRQWGKQPEYTAEQAVFEKSVFEIVKSAKAEGEALSLQFDQGRDTDRLRNAIKPTIEAAKNEGRFVSYGFLPVAQTPALQAADLVAYEAYRAFVPLLSDPKAEPRLHAKRLFEDDIFSGAAQWMGRKEIMDAARRFGQSRKRAVKRAKKERSVSGGSAAPRRRP